MKCSHESDHDTECGAVTNRSSRHARTFGVFLALCIVPVFTLGCPNDRRDESRTFGARESRDTEAPAIIEFGAPRSLTTRDTIEIDAAAEDNVGVVGWFLSTSDERPRVRQRGWIEQRPGEVALPKGAGRKVVYAWVKDAAGNVSEPATLTVTRVAPGTPVLQWSSDGNGGDDCVRALAVDRGGNIVLVGSGENLVDPSSGLDWWVMMIEAAEVAASIEGAASEHSAGILPSWERVVDGGYGDDEAMAVDIMTDPFTGDLVAVYVGGYRTGADGTTDWWIERLDSQGKEIVSNDERSSFGKPADGGAVSGTNDAVLSLQVDGSGNVIVAGYSGGPKGSTEGGTGEDWWLSTFKSGGIEITDWLGMRFDGAGGDDRALSVAFSDASGGIYFGGYGTNLVGPESGVDWWIRKFTPPGAEIDGGWPVRTDVGTEADAGVEAGTNAGSLVGAGTDDWLMSLALDEHGDLYAGGSSNGRWTVARYDADGSIAEGWPVISIAGGSDDSVYALAVTEAGTLVAGGTRDDSPSIRAYRPDGVEVTGWWNVGIAETGAVYAIVIDSHMMYAAGTRRGPAGTESGGDWWIEAYFDDTF